MVVGKVAKSILNRGVGGTKNGRAKPSLARKMATRGGGAMGIDLMLREFVTNPEGSFGENLVGSMAYGAGWAVAPWLMGAYEAGVMAKDVTTGLNSMYKEGKAHNAYQQSMAEANFGGGSRQPLNTEHAYTERQRAMAIAQHERRNASAYGMGYEARAMSRMQSRSH